MEEVNEYNKERLARVAKLEREKADQKKQQEAYVALVRSVKSDCNKKNSGLLAVKYKLEYIENGGMPPTGFAKETAIRAYKEGIEQYENQQQKDAEKREDKGL